MSPPVMAWCCHIVPKRTDRASHPKHMCEKHFLILGVTGLALALDIIFGALVRLSLPCSFAC